jgi:hypothetical protein
MMARAMHGQAFKAFCSASANPDIARRLGQFSPGDKSNSRLRQHYEITE